MPQPQLVFEGPTPESVIRDAWTVHGPSVQLTAPERIRSGGVAGFFSKPLYRVRVVPSTAAASPSTTAATPQGATAVSEPSPLDAMLDATPDVAIDLHGAPVRTFAEALERAAGSLGEERAPRSRSASRPAAQVDLTTAATADAPSSQARSILPSTPESSEADAAKQSTPTNDTAGPIDWDRLLAELRPVSEPVSPTPPAADEATSQLLADLASVRFPTQLLARAAGHLDQRLSLEGVCSVLPEARRAPDVPGALTAIVGPPARAVKAARAVAATLGLSERDVALALAVVKPSERSRRPLPEVDGLNLESFGPAQVVRSAADVEALSPGWRRDRVGVVAVALPDGFSSAPLGRALLRALRPSAVYAICDASAKPDDLQALLDAIGGVDALYLEGLDETVTPADVLSLGVPVARLDDAPATPARWASAIEDAVRRRNAPSGR